MGRKSASSVSTVFGSYGGIEIRSSPHFRECLPGFLGSYGGIEIIHTDGRAVLTVVYGPYGGIEIATTRPHRGSKFLSPMVGLKYRNPHHLIPTVFWFLDPMVGLEG